MPLSFHNYRIYALAKTNISYIDFCEYVGADCQGSMPKSKLREWLSKYLSDRIEYTNQ